MYRGPLIENLNANVNVIAFNKLNKCITVQHAVVFGDMIF